MPNIDDFETSNETDRSDEPLLRRRNFGCGGGGGGWGTPSTTDDSGNLVSTSSGSSFGHTRKGTNGQKLSIQTIFKHYVMFSTSMSERQDHFSLYIEILHQVLKNV